MHSALRWDNALLTVVGMPILIWFAASDVQAQRESGDDPLRFEVASVKPNQHANPKMGELQFLPRGRFIARNLPLYFVIATAWKLPPINESSRLLGAPAWLQSETFDIEATAEKGVILPGIPAKVRTDRMKLMLRSLLEDRFKLIVRRELREVPVYAIVVSKRGARLQKAKLEERDCAGEISSWDGVSCHSLQGGLARGIHGEAVDLGDVAVWIENWTDRPVVDRTGLKGLFNIQSEGWLASQQVISSDSTHSGGDRAVNDSDRQSINSVFEKLGLRIESQRASVEVFVIDHIERPTGN
jgi:uncharacterized protein (TIGR03435 family)